MPALSEKVGYNEIGSVSPSVRPLSIRQLVLFATLSPP